jgi:flagellar hook-associated protein 1 FlgK
MVSGASVKIGSLVLGNGVTIDQVRRVSDSYLESSLMDKTSDLACSGEKTRYLDSLETLFGSDSDSGLNALLSDYWSAWSDLANNPSGDAERVVLYETGTQLTEQFNTISLSLGDMTDSLNGYIDAAVSDINGITSRIAELNTHITALEAGGGSANDLRDQRDALLSDLSSLVGIKTFEESDGSVSVLTAKGFPIVSGGTTHSLDFSSGKVLWEGSQGDVDITDNLSGGQIGGWLEIRDVTIPTYQAELDDMANSLIYAVNLQASQGTGSDYVSEGLTGSGETDSSGLFSTLPYAGKLDTSADFVLWVRESSTDPAACTKVSVDLSFLDPVDSATLDLSGSANCVNGSYVFTLDPPTATLGGTDDVTVNWSSGRTQGSFTVAAGDLSSVYDVDGMSFSLSAESGPFTGGTFTATTDESGEPSLNVSSVTLSDVADRINTAVTAAGGGVTASVQDGHLVLTPDSSDYAMAFGSDDGTESGLAAILGLNTFFTGTDATSIAVSSSMADTENIPTGRIDPDTGAVLSGDNANALAIASIQDTSIVSRSWTFSRGGSPTSESMEGTPTSIYQALTSEIGIQAKAASAENDSNQDLLDFIQSQRDSVSAVSLDEEVINLTKYQTAYSAASKLLAVADEMLDTLLSIR